MDACTCHTVHCSNIDTHTHTHNQSICVCVYVTFFCFPAHRNLAAAFSSHSAVLCWETWELLHTHKHIAYNRVSIAAEDITWLTLRFLESYPNPNHHHCLLMYTQCIYTLYVILFSFLNSLLCLSLACSGPAWRGSALQELNHFCWPSVVRFGPKASALHQLKSWK